MGFTTGLIGGVTLTTAIIYLSLDLHARNRVQQATFLRQGALVLNNIVEPLPQNPSPPAREVRGGILETAKDRWNAELESNMRKVYEVDWDTVRDRVEASLSRLWTRAKEQSSESTRR